MIPPSELDERVAEYNLSLAHGDLSAILDDAVLMDKVLNRIYRTWPETFEQIELATRLLSRMVLRDNRARSFIAQELKRIPQ